MIELVTFDELKTFLDLADSEIDYPDLSLIKDSVVGAFESFTRRKFEVKERTFKSFKEFSTNEIFLEAYPLISVSQVKIGDNVLLVDDYFMLNKSIKLKKAFKCEFIEIIYTGGLSSIDESLKRAALLQTVYEYQNKNSVGIKNINNNGGSTNKETLGLLEEVKIILKNFKRLDANF